MKARMNRRLFQILIFPCLCLMASITSSKAQEAKPKPASIEMAIDFGDGLIWTFPDIQHTSKMTIMDAMNIARARTKRPLRFSHKGAGESAFLISIDDSANEGGGRSSRNWFYRVNHELGDQSFGLKQLKPGDKVLWHFGKYVPE